MEVSDHDSMDRTEYEQLKLAAEAKRKAADEDLQALERVWRMLKQVPGKSLPRPPAANDDPQQSLKVFETLKAFDKAGKGQLLGAIRAAIPKLATPFTFVDVMRDIKGQFPNIKKPSANSVLRRLVELNEIEIVTLGSGRTATTYRLRREHG